MNELPNLEPDLPPAEFYWIEARDASGDIASSGKVAADKVRRARRMFLEEGWTVTVMPLRDGQDRPDNA